MWKKINKKLSLFIFTVSLVMTIVAPVKFAKATTMSPIRIELDANPGGHTTGVVKVSNNEKVQRTYYLSVENFEARDETGQPNFIKGAKDGLVVWTKIPSSVTVPPLESKEVTFDIDVPTSVDPGGYFAAVFASIVPPSPEGNAVSLASDVGTLILFRVNGQFVEGENILEFNTKDKKNIYNHLPIEFYFRFQNSGKDRILPLGDITIRNMFGSVTKIVSSNKAAGHVLPQSVRRYEAAWVNAGGEQTEDFDGTVEQPKFKNFFDAVKYQWNNFAIGRYSADLKLIVNNDSSRAYAKSLSFWILPWQLIVVIAAIIVLFILPLLLLITMLLIYIKRRSKK